MEKLDLRGNHTELSKEEIDQLYQVLKQEHALFLAQFGVKMPAPYTTKALWLVFLRKYKGIAVHKDTISSFVEQVLPSIGKDQQVRHLAADGWFVLNRGDKIPEKNQIVPSGYHILITTEQPKPSFIFNTLKRAGRMAAKNFGDLKAAYDFRCATCGSQEGKPHFLEPNKRTELQQGHKDPRLPLSLENTIPQCQVCNQVYKDTCVFDDKGRVVAIASPALVLRADKNIQKQVRDILDAVVFTPQ